jgi:UDP-N-acetyl-D-mannosaminuronic acid transferase (WecB/TagA/CpsF family)
MGFESDPAQLRAIHASLLLAQPDLVLVALGSPKQDRLT